jgi:hypothetical protein
VARVVGMESRNGVRSRRYGRLRKCPRRSRDGREEANRRHLPVTGKRAAVTESVAQGAAQYSQALRGGDEVCSHVWRGVVSGGIVSHPSRQQSGGVGTRERPPSWGCRGDAAMVTSDSVQRRRDMRRWVRCEFRSRARDGARDAGVSGGVLEW